MPKHNEEFTREGCALYLSLMAIIPAAIGLSLGFYGLLGGGTIYLRGIFEPTVGEDAKRPEVILIIVGFAFLTITSFGLRYALPRLRKSNPKKPSLKNFNWSLKPRPKPPGSEDAKN
jgi:hypothetical protein